MYDSTTVTIPVTRNLSAEFKDRVGMLQLFKEEAEVLARLASLGQTFKLQAVVVQDDKDDSYTIHRVSLSPLIEIITTLEETDYPRYIFPADADDAKMVGCSFMTGALFGGFIGVIIGSLLPMIAYIFLC